MAQQPVSVGFLTFVAVIAVVVAGIGAGLLYLHNTPKAGTFPATVAVGDNVTVNYIGIFASGPEQGKVFDTSLKSAATDNATYPKSLEYTPRSASGYTPLPVHVGPNTPSSGYNVSGVTYGGVVTGFWKGLVGLSVNQSRLVTVPPNEGYGSLNQSCLRTMNLTQTIPVLVSVTPQAFAKAYPKGTAAAGASFVDPTYGWTDMVVSANTTAVVVQRMPSLEESVSPFGWTMEVVGLTSRNITLYSELTPSSVGSILGTMSNLTVCSTTKFLLWSVDLAAGTFTVNYNKEVVGETLLFDVTLVSIVGA